MKYFFPEPDTFLNLFTTESINMGLPGKASFKISQEERVLPHWEVNSTTDLVLKGFKFSLSHLQMILSVMYTRSRIQPVSPLSGRSREIMSLRFEDMVPGDFC